MPQCKLLWGFLLAVTSVVWASVTGCRLRVDLTPKLYLITVGDSWITTKLFVHGIIIPVGTSRTIHSIHKFSS
jgi:hypothetical protein